MGNESALADAIAKLKINQNLVALIVSFVALGIGEYHNLCYLKWFGIIMSGISVLSVVLTLIVYTYEYCKRKCSKTQEK